MKSRERRASAIRLALASGLLVSAILVACGGSSSETPYPLEPRPRGIGNLGGSSSK